jgi:hypothetical protein
LPRIFTISSLVAENGTSSTRMNGSSFICSASTQAQKCLRSYAMKGQPSGRRPRHGFDRTPRGRQVHCRCSMSSVVGQYVDARFSRDVAWVMDRDQRVGHGATTNLPRCSRGMATLGCRWCSISNESIRFMSAVRCVAAARVREACGAHLRPHCESRIPCLQRSLRNSWEASLDHHLVCGPRAERPPVTHSSTGLLLHREAMQPAAVGRLCFGHTPFV